MMFLTDMLVCPGCSSIEHTPYDAGDKCICGDSYECIPGRIATLETQLAAQKAIVAADDAYQRVKYDMKAGLDEELAAFKAMETTREAAQGTD